MSATPLRAAVSAPSNAKSAPHASEPAVDAPADNGLESSSTRVVADQAHHAIHFIIDGKEVATLTPGKFHVNGVLNGIFLPESITGGPPAGFTKTGAPAAKAP